MARLKKKSVENQPALTRDQIKEKWQELDRGVTRLITKLLMEKGISQASFGRRIGFSQPNINHVFSEDHVNHWSMPLLIATSEYLGVPLYEIIKAAQLGGDMPWLAVRLARTLPHTMDRLELIVQAVAPEGTDGATLNLYYSAQMFSIAAPDYVRRYADGELTDEEVYSTLKEAAETAPDEGSMWTQIHEMLNPSGKGPFSRA